MCWRCWLGGRKGIWPVKTEWWGAGMVICLERGANLHIAQLMPLPLTVSHFSKIQICFTFLVPAYPGSLGKSAGKRVCVCVCVRACVRVCYFTLDLVELLLLTAVRLRLSWVDTICWSRFIANTARHHWPSYCSRWTPSVPPASRSQVSHHVRLLWLRFLLAFHWHTHTLNGLCLGLPGWAGTRKVKPIWILLKRKDDESQVLKGNLTWL